MRKITSLTLLLAGLIELITSVVLYIIPQGRVAYWADYRLMGLSKSQWADVHITVGVLLLLMVALHVYYNWRAIMAYVKNKAREVKIFTKSFNAALLLTLFVTVGTLWHLPPMSYVLQLGEYFTERGNEIYGEPPYGHAELSSLTMFCQKVDLDLNKALSLLNEAGIRVSGPNSPVGEIATANGISPQEMYKVMKPATLVPEQDATFPNTPNASFGKQTIKEICTRHHLSLPTVMNALAEHGIQGTAEQTVKEIGAANDSNPMVIFEILQKIAVEETRQRVK